MSHFTKYGKRMRLMLLTAMFVASMVCLFAIPFVEKNLLNNQVAYYRIEVNGTEVGAAIPAQMRQKRLQMQEDGFPAFILMLYIWSRSIR